MQLRWPSFGRARERASGVTEAKASAAGPLIAMQALGRPVWTPRDYAALAREGLMRNPVVFRAVRMIAEGAASVPWVLYESGRELDAHPVLDLLRRPNARQSGKPFLEAVYGYVLVAGNAYVEAVTVEDEVRELHALRPDRMRIEVGGDGWPSAYVYSVGGRSMRFRQDDGARPILHLSLFHPLDDHYGLAPLEAAQTSLDIHNAAAAWHKALLDNSARPSGALVYQGRDGGNLTDEQFARLKKELEDGYQGARNAGRPLLLEGGLDWRTMGFSPKEMDFIEAKNAAARDIALAFGVPPMLLGIPGDNTYANYQEANRALWRQTILPLIGRMAEELVAWLAPGLELKPDLDAVMALTAEREPLWPRLARADFISVNEKRAALGYGPVEGGDVVSGHS